MFDASFFNFEEGGTLDNNFNDFSLYHPTGDINNLFESAPKCSEDYVEPPVAKRQRFSSNSTTLSSSSESTTENSASPVTDSLAALSQKVVSIQKQTESTSSSNTTPQVTSKTTQQATRKYGQKSTLSQVSTFELNNSSRNELPITPSNGQVTGPPTTPVVMSVSPHSNLFQVPTTTTPGIYQTPSATHMLVPPESHQMIHQQPGAVTGIPLPPTMRMHIESNPRSSRKPFTGLIPVQNLAFARFGRSTNHQTTSIPQGPVLATLNPTENATSICLPSRSTSNFTSQPSPPEALDRSSIKPQLREVMEKFETKIKMDEDLRNAFNIVFPGRLPEVETLKQTILNERRQAAIRENALKREIREFQESATTQDALQSRAMDVLAELRTNPQMDRSWMCLNQDKDTGGLCHRVHKEFYLANKVWKRRERCTKCRAKIFEKNRKYFNNDAEVSAWTSRNVTPAMPNTPRFLKRTRDMVDDTSDNSFGLADPPRRQSLPTLPVSKQPHQQSAASRWASLPPPTQKKTRDHTPLFNSKDTQSTLRAALGTSMKPWMQEPKQIETIVLDDDSDEGVETNQSQESPDKSPAVEQQPNVEDSMDAGFDADFEAEMEAELTAALEAELA